MSAEKTKTVGNEHENKFIDCAHTLFCRVKLKYSTGGRRSKTQFGGGRLKKIMLLSQPHFIAKEA